MKDDILIINNKRYVHTPDVKEERKEGFVNEYGVICIERKSRYDTRMIEIKENEIILSEDDVKNAWLKAEYVGYPTAFFKALGFKKDGV